MELHRLLSRQLKKSGFRDDEIQTDPRLKVLLEKINNTYAQTDEERYINERANDISSREMQDLYKELEASSKSAINLERDKLNRILMNIGYGLLVLDSDDVIVDNNRATLNILDCQPQDILGKHFQTLLQNTNTTNTEVASFTTDIATFSASQNGQSALVSFIKTAVDINHPELGSVVVFHEISEAIKQNESLIEAKNEALRANKAKSEFLSRMSHELRTPLHAIMGFTQLLSMDCHNFSVIQNKNLTKIDKASNHLLSLINELLDFSRIEAGRVDIDMVELSIAFHLLECVDLLKSDAVLGSVKIENQVTDMGVFVLADKVRLKQVIFNLLSNAIKYNREGGTVSLRMSNVLEKHVRLTVQDEGGGLTEEEVSRLFRNYERIGKGSGTEGTGLGLVITKKLVELMEGTLSVDSIVGRGTSFHLDLKVADGQT